jgi:hypothetical protein
MAALVRTLQADGVFNDIRKLYGIASVASQTMVLSTSLSQLDVMVSMARALRGVPNENIIFIDYPVLGRGEQTRTSMGYSGSISPSQQTSVNTPQRTSRGSRGSSMSGHEWPLGTGVRQSYLPACSSRINNLGSKDH